MTSIRKILLTGCSRGLGRALLDEFDADGHVVAGCSRSNEQMQALHDAFDGRHFLHSLDVSDDAAVDVWVQAAVEHIGVPDLVINNAALINTPAPLWTISTAEFQHLLSVNLSGVHHVIRHVLPLMITHGRGVIVNLSSGWGRSVSAEMAPYCATKWGIEGLTKALAAELPAGLAAMPISPGVIDTDMLREAWGEGAGGYRTAAQWATQAAPYLLSLNETHNGQSLTTPG